MEPERHENAGENSTDEQPCAAANKKVGDRAPQEVEHRRQGQEVNELGLISAADALAAE